MLGLHLLLLVVLIGYYIYSKSQSQSLSQFSSIILNLTGIVTFGSVLLSCRIIHGIRTAANAKTVDQARRDNLSAQQNSIEWFFYVGQIVMNILVSLAVCGYSMQERGKLTLKAFIACVSLTTIGLASYGIHESRDPVGKMMDDSSNNTSH